MFLKKNNERISYFILRFFYRRFLQRLFSARGLFSLLDHQYHIYSFFDKIGILLSLSHKMDSILSHLAILTGVLSPSILSVDILSMHRVICPATKGPSMKIHTCDNPRPHFREILYLPLYSIIALGPNLRNDLYISDGKHLLHTPICSNRPGLNKNRCFAVKACNQAIMLDLFLKIKYYL